MNTQQRKELVSIQVDWLNEDSIKLAEMSKEYLENHNYRFVTSFGGNNLGTFLYTKIKGATK